MNHHRLIQITGLLGLWVVGSACAQDLYVAPTGLDSNPGSRQRPLATLEAARNAVRAQIARGMTKDVTVYLAAGNYFIEKPLVLDERDSGRDGYKIIYQGAPKLGSRIYGGRRITNWQKLNDKEYAADVPDLQQHYTLYENDVAANGGTFHDFAGVPEGNWRREGTKLIYTPRNPVIDKQVIVLGTAKDVFRIEGRSMRQLAGNLVFDGLYMIGSDFAPEWKKGDSYTTNWSGEYDGREWGGKSLGDSVIAPDMRHGQFYVENGRNVTIRNSKLYGAGFMGAMFNRWAQQGRVENCWIEMAGCNGLFFMGWECGRGPFKSVAESYVNKKHIVRNNVFYDIGRFSFYGAGMYFNFSGDNLIEHNIFHGITHYGVTHKGWNPAAINALYATNRDLNLKPDEKIVSYGMENVKLYGDYVVTEANQGAAVNHARNNTTRYNDFSQIPRGGDDMGMISMWCAGTGNVWNYNVLHDGVNNAGWDNSWMHVLFNDDGSHGATLQGNMIYWCAGGRMSRAIMCKGNEQKTINNIIADCDLSAAATIGPYTLQAHNMIWSRNIVASQIGTLYFGGGGTEKVGGVEYPILKEADNNLYYVQPENGSKPDAKEAQRIEQLVNDQKRGGKFEKNSLYADPQFERKNPWWNTTYTDYRLKAGSPALKLGFEQTDLQKIGLLAGYPFSLDQVFAHPAGQVWKAANYHRVYLNRISGGQLVPRGGRSLVKNSWTRYDRVDFGDGRYRRFTARAGWVAPKQTFEKEIDGKKFEAVDLGDVWIPHPYWEVSPAYQVKGKTGPQLFDVPFAAEKEPASVKWKAITEPQVSRLTVKYPLGLVNLDIANGENHANSAAYARSSMYAKGGGKTNIEIRGDYGVKLWVNGELVFSQLGKVNQSQRVPVTFKKGWNELLLKVVQDDQPWKPTEGNGNFWATVNIHYAAIGSAFIVPGLPGKEVMVDPDPGAAVELRLDAPNGKRIGALNFKQTSCEIEKTTGRHTLFLVFPNENVQSMDWYRFE